MKAHIKLILKELENANVKKDEIDARKWRGVFQEIIPELDQIDKDLLISMGYKKSKDIKKLSIEVLLLNQ